MDMAVRMQHLQQHLSLLQLPIPEEHIQAVRWEVHLKEDVRNKTVRIA